MNVCARVYTGCMCGHQNLQGVINSLLPHGSWGLTSCSALVVSVSPAEQSQQSTSAVWKLGIRTFYFCVSLGPLKFHQLWMGFFLYKECHWILIGTTVSTCIIWGSTALLTVTVFIHLDILFFFQENSVFRICILTP